MRFWTILLVMVLLLSMILSCSDRKRWNPLDPLNPETKGKPTGLDVVSERHNVTLSWDAFSLDGILGYNVYRLIEGEGKFYNVKFVPADSSRFVDNNLDYDRLVTYRISAVATQYESPQSDGVATTPGPYNYWVVDRYMGYVARLTYDGLHVMTQSLNAFYPLSVVADSVSKTAWVIDGMGYLVKLSSRGMPLLWIEDLIYPTHVALDPFDSVVWICDDSGRRVTRYDTAGNLLGTTDGFGEIVDICWAGPRGGCWVADGENNDVMLISSSGDVEVREENAFHSPHAISNYQREGWMWVADSLGLGRIWLDGRVEKIVEMNRPVAAVSVDQATGNCWVVIELEDGAENEVLKLNVNGDVLTRVEGFRYAQSLAANDFNGGCIVADTGNSRIVRISAGGKVLSSYGGFISPYDIAVE